MSSEENYSEKVIDQLSHCTIQKLEERLVARCTDHVSFPTPHKLNCTKRWRKEIISELLCKVEDVFDMLCTLDMSKASGPDGISGRMLKNTACSIAPALTKIFNLSISTGIVPDEWKLSHIVQI